MLPTIISLLLWTSSLVHVNCEQLVQYDPQFQMEYEDEDIERPNLLERFRRQIGDFKSQHFSRFNDDVHQVSPEFPSNLRSDLIPIMPNSSFFPERNMTPPENESLYQENHIYYKMTLLNMSSTNKGQYYVDFNRINTSSRHEALSKSHLKAAGIQLSFDFPFYGYKIRNLTIATGGFIFTGNPDHSWIAATQYIAPLMADFSFADDEASHIRYMDNGTAFTIEWKNARLHENTEAGNFSFQATLKKDGTIIFYYEQIPIAINQVPNDTHPVKIGISDAYLIDRHRFIIRYRTIYEYHRIAMQHSNITSGSVILLQPLPTCIAMDTCTSCLSHGVDLGCRWCEASQRCSDGVDRFHQEWFSSGCHDSSTNSTCPVVKPTLPPKTVSKSSSYKKKDMVVTPATKANGKLNDAMLDYSATGTPKAQSSKSAAEQSKYTILRDGNSGTATVERIGPVSAAQGSPSSESSRFIAPIVSVTAVLLLGSLIGWVAYAYLRPQSPAGQWLIRYRPSQWRRPREDEIHIASTNF